MSLRDAAPTPAADVAARLPGGGDMGARMRAHDWSRSPLGAPTAWPRSLLTVTRLLLDSKFPMFVAWGEDLGFLYNDAYAEILGAKHPKALGRPFREIWAEIWSDISPLIDAALSGRPTYSENLPLTMNRKGFDEETWFTFSYSPVHDDDGRVAGMFCAVAETTGQVLAESRLRKLNETLGEQVALRVAERDQLWTLSQDMLARADYDGMMSAVSPAWGEVLGWSEAELLSRGYATFMHPDDAPPTLEALEQMGRTGQPTRFENRIATRDGGWKSIEWTVAPERDGANFIAIGRDVSAARKQEADLAAAQEALRQSQKMEAMGQLTGGVAHDFNNLLTPIVGALDMLQRRAVGGPRDQRLIAGAAQSAERARVLVQRLLAFARRQPLSPVPVDIARLVRDMADLVSSTIGPHIRVTVQAAEDLPWAIAEANQLEMAILNLAVNARDAMPDGGSLTIRAATAVHRDAPVALRPGAYVRLTVQDTGEGMDAATLARAAEPFFSTKGVGRGTGLGLSMVHGLASQLGGALTISSRPGAGTAVDLWLPQTASGETLQPAPPTIEARGADRVALLVDDEEFVRLSTAEMLKDLGYRVVEASSAVEALRAIANGAAVDLVVTDHLMAGMTGADLAQALRASHPDLPVIVVSGYAEEGGIAPDLPRLTKPFRQDELAASLAALSRGGD
ncbi:PAS domain-containing protein [Phenylobacterium sp.]|uniref:hybrid sensor histidine kinase/response regulator n=1 Tax=Phenylobacterium sp. TaxID=1871053 RepID=UPI0025F2D57E|nr:PAS domain-containing protein [Phenylobacterium sp.]